jgi:hypothetical protein
MKFLVCSPFQRQIAPFGQRLLVVSGSLRRNALQSGAPISRQVNFMTSTGCAFTATFHPAHLLRPEKKRVWEDRRRSVLNCSDCA